MQEQVEKNTQEKVQGIELIPIHNEQFLGIFIEGL